MASRGRGCGTRMLDPSQWMESNALWRTSVQLDRGLGGRHAALQANATVLLQPAAEEMLTAFCPVSQPAGSGLRQTLAAPPLVRTLFHRSERFRARGCTSIIGRSGYPSYTLIVAFSKKTVVIFLVATLRRGLANVYDARSLLRLLCQARRQV